MPKLSRSTQLVTLLHPSKQVILDSQTGLFAYLSFPATSQVLTSSKAFLTKQDAQALGKLSSDERKAFPPQILAAACLLLGKGKIFLGLYSTCEANLIL